MVGHPIPEILGQSDRVGAKSPIFDLFSLVTPQLYDLAKKVQLTLIVWNPQDGRLSLREWELSLPRLGVAPEVVADDALSLIHI